jgi:hypothetical protein
LLDNIYFCQDIPIFPTESLIGSNNHKQKSTQPKSNTTRCLAFAAALPCIASGDNMFRKLLAGFGKLWAALRNRKPTLLETKPTREEVLQDVLDKANKLQKHLESEAVLMPPDNASQTILRLVESMDMVIQANNDVLVRICVLEHPEHLQAVFQNLQRSEDKKPDNWVEATMGAPHPSDQIGDAKNAEFCLAVFLNLVTSKEFIAFVKALRAAFAMYAEKK